MRKIVLTLVFELIIAAVPTLAPGYDWPLIPWGNVPVHGVNATLGEFRPPWEEGDYHFHKGIDLRAAAFTPVFASDSGRVVRPPGPHWVRIGNEVYRHVIRHRHYLKDYLDGEENVPMHFRIADVQLLRRQGRDISHLHFEELGANNVPVNPFADGHLVTAPDFDTEWPQVVDMWFQRNNTDTCLPEQNHTTIVRGRIDIVARAKDEMPDPGSENVGLYRMACLVRDRYRNLVSDTIESCRFDAVPNQDQIFDCYQEVITFADSSQDSTHLGFWRGQQYIPTRFYYIATWRHGSRYDYWNTNRRRGAAEDVDADSIGQAEYPDERYRVAVLAWDRAENGGVEDSARGADTTWVLVDNFLPIVVSTYPDSGQIGVPPDTNIRATFSEPMAESTITSSRVIVVEMGDPPDTVAGVLSYDDSTYTVAFNPDSSLEGGAEYEVTISDSLTDLANNRLDGDENGVAGGDYSWSFTVAEEEPLIYVVDDDNCIFWVLRPDGSVDRTWTLDPEDYYIRDICVDRSKNCYALGDDWNAGKNVVLKLNSEGQLVDTYQLEYNDQWRSITTDNTHYYVGGDGKVLKYECATGEFKGSWEVGLHDPWEISYSYYSGLLYVYSCETSERWSLVEAWPTTGGEEAVYASELDHWYATGLAVDEVGLYSCGRIWQTASSAGIRVWNLDLSQVVHYWEQEPHWCSDQLEILGDNILCIEMPSVMPPWPKLKVRDKFTGDLLEEIYEFDYEDCLPFSMAVYNPSLPVGGENLAGPEGGGRIPCFDDRRSVPRPERFSLLQNFPNPVVEHATVGYAVPHEASVELKIYDVGGGLVRTLVGGSMGPGYYSVDWDGKDIVGRPVSGGVYFYRLVARHTDGPPQSRRTGGHAGDFTATRKMVVLR